MQPYSSRLQPCASRPQPYSSRPQPRASRLQPFAPYAQLEGSRHTLAALLLRTCWPVIAPNQAQLKDFKPLFLAALTADAEGRRKFRPLLDEVAKAGG